MKAFNVYRVSEGCPRNVLGHGGVRKYKTRKLNGMCFYSGPRSVTNIKYYVICDCVYDDLCAYCNIL